METKLNVTTTVSSPPEPNVLEQLAGRPELAMRRIEAILKLKAAGLLPHAEAERLLGLKTVDYARFLSSTLALEGTWVDELRHVMHLMRAVPRERDVALSVLSVAGEQLLRLT